MAYQYNLNKEGHVDENGFLDGLNVRDKDTNSAIVKKINKKGCLFTRFPYQHKFYEDVKTSERILLRTTKSWFMQVPDHLRMACYEELAMAKFSPKLNLKDAKEVHEDFEKL